MKKNRWLLALACLGLLSARPALAHSGLPYATELFFNQQNGTVTESIQTSYGLLQQDSAGAWRLTCEETLEPGLKIYKVWPDGSFGFGYSEGYAWSDDGCNFHQAMGLSGPAVSVQTADFTASGGPQVLVVFTTLLDSQEFGTNLHVSADHGHTFQQVFVPGGVNIGSVAVLNDATPQVVLVAQDTGSDADGGMSSTPQRWLLKSSKCLTTPGCTADDWEQIPLDVSLFGQGITDVLAATPEGIFLRVRVNSTWQVLRSTDGGHSFTQVLPAQGQQVGPDPILYIDRAAPNDLWAAGGLQEAYHSSDGGATWQLRKDLGDIRCVRSDGTKLHSCVVNTAVVTNASADDGATWTPEFDWTQVKGIKQCPPDSDVGNGCDDLWVVIESSFQQQVQQFQQQPAPPAKHGCASTEVGVLGLVIVGLVRRRRGVSS